MNEKHSVTSPSVPSLDFVSKLPEDDTILDESRTRTRFKQAVLQELNAQLHVKAEKIRIHLRSEPWMPVDENHLGGNAGDKEQRQMNQTVVLNKIVPDDGRLQKQSFDIDVDADLPVLKDHKAAVSVAPGYKPTRQIVPPKKWIRAVAGKDSTRLTMNVPGAPSKPPISQLQIPVPQKTNSAKASGMDGPVTPVRQRHRVTVHGSNAVVKGRVNVMSHYRPDYTWNRGGRFKELRIRCLARKFFHLWRWKVFGRVSPAAARLHFERHLKRKVFYEWTEMWWETRREWVLSVRAELHYRYFLWNTTFKAWRVFTFMRRAKRKKQQSADNFACRLVLAPILSAWRNYMTSRQTGRNLKLKAARIHIDMTMRLAWHRWKDCTEARKQEQEQEKFALSFWALSLTMKFWNYWRKAIEGRNKEWESLIRAAKHHETALSRRCLRALRTNVEMKRERRLMCATAWRLHEKHLLKEYFSEWRHEWSYNVSLSQHENVIIALSTRCRLRRAFVHWRHFVDLKKTNRQIRSEADRFFERHLMKSTLSTLKLNVVSEHTKTLRCTLADQFRNYSMTRTAWSTWEAELERKEENRIRPATTKARQNFRYVTLRKSFHLWRTFVFRKHQQQIQVLRACVKHDRRVALRCLRALQMYAQRQQHKRQMSETAHEFLQLNVEWLYFNEWRSRAEESRNDRLMTRMAVLHDNESTLKRYMLLWVERLQERQESAYNWSKAVSHRKKYLLKKAFLSWSIYASERQSRYENILIATRHLYIRYVQKSWVAWRLFVVMNKQRRVQETMAIEHYERRLLRTMFTRLNRHHLWLKERIVLVEERTLNKNRLLLRATFHRWNMCTKWKKLKKQKQSIAADHRNRVILHRIFTVWHTYAMTHAVKKFTQSNQLSVARDALNTATLRSIFHQWRRNVDTARQARRCEEIALKHERHIILSRAMFAWHAYVKQAQRSLLLLRQSAWLRKTRLLADHFLRWRAAYIVRSLEINKSNSALWVWSQNLQRKVFHAWYSYIVERRRKSGRYADALEAYRRRLLCRGLTQLLAVSADLSRMRQKRATELGMQQFYHANQLALKYASHWRHLVARRGTARVTAETMETGKEKSDDTIRAGIVIANGHLAGPIDYSSALPSFSSRRSHRYTTNVSEFNELLMQVPVLERISRPAPRRPSWLYESLDQDLRHYAQRTTDLSMKTDEDCSVGSHVQKDGDELMSAREFNTASFSEQLDPHFADIAGFNASGHHDTGLNKYALHDPIPKLTARPYIITTADRSRANSYPDYNVHPDSNASAGHVVLRGDTIKTITASAPDHVVFPRQLNRVPAAPPTRYQLLPPSAFLVTRDGKPIPNIGEDVEKGQGEGVHLNGRQGDSAHAEYRLDAQGDRVSGCDNEDVVAADRHAEVTGPQMMQQGIQTGGVLQGQDGRTVDPEKNDLAEIRQKLARFQENKQKLRTLCEQKKQLVDWLDKRSSSSHYHDDNDVSGDKHTATEVDEELKAIEIDIKKYAELVGKEKSTARDLAQKAKQLLLSTT